MSDTCLRELLALFYRYDVAMPQLAIFANSANETKSVRGLMLFAAPFSIVPGAGFFAAPFWWAALGWVLKSGWRWLSIPMIGVHTAAVGLILRYGTGRQSIEDEWRYFHRFAQFEPEWLWTGIAVHALGCLVACFFALRPRVTSANT